jgi:hypothetical protein
MYEGESKKMKYFLYITIVLFAIVILSSIAYAKIDPKTAVGMWVFDEGVGEIAKDSSGNNSDITLNNGVQWVDGQFNKSLSFDGIDDFALAVVPNAPQGSSVRTLLGWAKSNNPGIKCGVVAYGNPVLNGVFGFLHYSGIWYSQLWGAEPDFDAPTKVKVDTLWHHHAVLYDGKNISHYIDGVVVSSEPRNPATVGTTLIIGEEVDRNEWFNGLIDEVAIFSVVLGEDDIKSIMSKGLKSFADVSLVGKLSTTWGQIKN